MYDSSGQSPACAFSVAVCRAAYSLNSILQSFNYFLHCYGGAPRIFITIALFMKKQQHEKKKSTPGAVTGGKTKLIRESHPPIMELIRTLAPAEKKDSKEDYECVVLPKLDPTLVKPLVRSMFKADHPYRTKIGVYGTFQTSAAGVIALNYTVSTITSATEWTTLDALFDEIFIHSMLVKYEPYNLTGGFGPMGAGSGNAMATTITVGAGSTTVWTCGLIMCCLFNGGSTYGTASGMLANPNHRHAHVSRPWSYRWRNNVKFDPRGPNVSASLYQGWTSIGSISNYGGSINIRATNDVKIGDQAHALSCGDVAFVWDISLRSRA